MKTFYLLLAFFFQFATIGLQAQDDEITWLGDYKEAIRQARQTHKPIFIEFRCEA